MSEFMLLIRNQGNPMQGLSEAEVGAHMEKWVKWMGGLGEQGKMQGGKPFSPESAAILSNGGSEVTKGFHTEANDVNVGG